ncbi:MAG: hypothetical protein KGJ38_08220 [Burkholderiaceae bacterium]|nr:hypothetical protein [Burkholderiaceae bacterium]
MTCGALVLGLHLATAHFDTSRRHHNVNPGGYVMCDNVVAGAYVNSHWRNSTYAGYVWHVGRVDIVTGAITGYGRGGPAPLIAPSVLLGGHVRLTLLPPVKLSDWGGVHLSWETPL